MKTNEYNNIGWLLLMFLNKEVKEKVELRDMNLQHKLSVRDLKVSVCTLKETLTSYHSAEGAENQMQTPILPAAEL